MPRSYGSREKRAIITCTEAASRVTLLALNPLLRSARGPSAVACSFPPPGGVSNGRGLFKSRSPATACGAEPEPLSRGQRADRGSLGVGLVRGLRLRMPQHRL